MIRNLKNEVHHLKKKLKKAKDEILWSKKICSEQMIEVTRQRQVHKKDSMDYIIKKRNFEVELKEIKKHASKKS